MRKILLVFGFVFVCASATMAQAKVDAVCECPTPAVMHKIEIPDSPNHSYVITKNTCTATKGTIDGVKEVTGDDVQFMETQGNSIAFHGRFVDNMANGDKLYVTYSGSVTTDGSKPGRQKWTVTGGTGKFKAAKGGGTCSTASVKPDGSGTWPCTGSVTFAK